LNRYIYGVGKDGKKMSQYSNEPEQSGTPGPYSGTPGPYGPATSNVPPPSRPRRRRLLGIIAALIALLLIILVLLFFFPRPTAAVTLTPASKTLSNSSMMTVAARMLSSAQQGSQTGVPTGPPKPGTQAKGTLTFINYTSVGVTVPKGTVVTDVTGQQVVTDKDVFVPRDPIIPGIASVTATAVKVGESGNIQARSINKLYSSGIYVVNSDVFSGGLDAQTVNTVLQSDIDSAANTLETSLMQKAESDIQSQLKSGEQLVTATPRCSITAFTSNIAAGESAANFTVNASLACSDSAYNPQTALSQGEDTLKQIATQQLGPDFLLVGNIATKVEQATANKSGNVDVLISEIGTWKYQFTAARKLDLAKHIARETRDAATAWLLQQTGVAAASISISGSIINLNNNVLPDDLKAITING
jgi:baseplate J-like protein